MTAELDLEILWAFLTIVGRKFGVRMLRITSGVTTLGVSRAMSQTQAQTSQALQEIASGSRLTGAAADPAGIAIADGLDAQARGTNAARRNAENANSFVSVAQGALQEQSNIVIRMRELAVQAASDTYSDTERGYLNQEFSQLKQEIDRIAQSTKFGSQTLLNGDTKGYEFQVGINKGDENVIKFENDTNTTLKALDLKSESIDDKDSAQDALESLDSALTQVSAARAKIGAAQSRMDFTINQLQSQEEGLNEAHSKISDADIPDAVSRAKKGMALGQYQAAVLQMANQQLEIPLRLIA